MTENSQKIDIFDTTLRDGQQSPGAGILFEDNILYADMAHKLNIDILEAGFPSASQTDFNIVRTISDRMTQKRSTMTISGLCQLREAQVNATMEALARSNTIGRARVHTYFPVDPNLLAASLGSKPLDKHKTIHSVYDNIKRARDAGYEVEFSPEGYSRVGENFDFTTDLIRAAISAGAAVINCPDTIGGGCRREGEQYFVNLMQKHADMMANEFPGTHVTWSAHCHNDFGLGLENTMNAVFDGPATQIEGCINGVGERAGNTALEQCIIYLREFGYTDPRNLYTDIDITYLKQISDFIAEKMLPRQPHSPIVGANATRHTSGGHTNAILKNPLAYQPFDPKDIGSEISFVFGPLSGSNHAKTIIEQFGYVCPNDKKAEIAQYIKDEYQDRRKGITDYELVAAYKKYCSPIKAETINYYRTDSNSVRVQLNGQFFNTTHIDRHYEGENSALAALSQAVQEYMPGVEVEDYHSESTSGRSVDAMSQSHIQISYNGHLHKGVAEDHDIEISALKAFINAVNNAYIENNCRDKAESREQAHA